MSRRTIATLMAAALVLGGCGSATLDRQQQEAMARGCASLAERGTTRRTKPAEVAGEVVDIRSDPEGFYEHLIDDRGPEYFRLEDPRDAARTQNSRVSDGCKVKDASDSSSSTESDG